jgi:hypothetical protein
MLSFKKISVQPLKRGFSGCPRGVFRSFLNNPIQDIASYIVRDM